MNSQTLGTRMSRRLRDLNWTQSKLASRIGVSQAVVSSYLRDLKMPSRETLKAIANALEVSQDYLTSGDRSPHSVPNAMATTASDLSWYERPAPDDGTRSYGNARAELFRFDYDVLARETGQNSNDASLGNEVSMEYRLGVLTGANLDRFLKALKWEQLQEHYECVASDVSHRTARRYGRALRQPEESQALWLLRIDDYNTTGLIGEEFGRGSFSALVRFTQDSQKYSRGDASGGRFGLGSASLSSASGFDLVLFCSDLSQPVDTKTQGRLIGRAVFPYHSLANGKEYEGPFFFGRPEPEQPARRSSAWSAEPLRRDLWLHRDGNGAGKTGTSILIVGYHDPDGNDLDPRTAENAIAALASSFENWFWPAIVRGRLSARFTRYDNDRKISERVVDSSNINTPFVSLFSGEADIVERAIPLRVPKSKDGDGPFDHSAKLLVQLLPDDRGQRVDELAMMRGALMVVKYRAFSGLALGARPFRAALLCGEAAPELGQPPSGADNGAELFLAKAEPPQHNDWTSRGTDLTSEYRGGAAELERMLEAVRTALREIVTPPVEDSSVGPEALRKLLALPVGVRPAGKKAEIVRLDWRNPDFSALAVTVRVNFRKGRDTILLRPQLYVETDAGSGIDLPCRIAPESGCELINDTAITLTDGAR